MKIHPVFITTLVTRLKGTCVCCCTNNNFFFEKIRGPENAHLRFGLLKMTFNKNDINLDYSHNLINSVTICLYLCNQI